MTFAAIQAAYAARNVPTYPLTADKTPAVKSYGRIGAPYSAQLAMKYADATAAGFCAGPRNRVTVIDIDSTDEKLVDDVEKQFGRSPLHTLTPSGGRHLHYRHNNERRRIRPLPSVDILGAGNVVCAGSQTPKGRYQFVKGSLDDLDRLPPLRDTAAPPQRPEKVQEGRRNNELFNYCRSIVGHCDTLDQLLDAARTWAEGRLAGQLPDAEIVTTAGSVWRFRGGRKLFMQHIIEGPLFPRLIADPEVWTVCSYLMIEQGPTAEFWIADGLAEARGWSRRMVPKARKALLDMGIIKCVRKRGNGVPALYRWSMPDAE